MAKTEKGHENAVIARENRAPNLEKISTVLISLSIEYSGRAASEKILLNSIDLNLYDFRPLCSMSSV